MKPLWGNTSVQLTIHNALPNTLDNCFWLSFLVLARAGWPLPGSDIELVSLCLSVCLSYSITPSLLQSVVKALVRWGLEVMRLRLLRVRERRGSGGGEDSCSAASSGGVRLGIFISSGVPLVSLWCCSGVPLVFLWPVRCWVATDVLRLNSKLMAITVAVQVY